MAWLPALAWELPHAACMIKNICTNTNLSKGQSLQNYKAEMCILPQIKVSFSFLIDLVAPIKSSLYALSKMALVLKKCMN